MEKQNFEISVDQSTIAWTGRQVTGSNSGSIAIKQGTLIVTDGKLTGGRIVVDVTSIKALSLSDAASNDQLTTHLASDDFFSSAQYPEATYEITSVTNNHVDGNLTIKGITNEIGFDATVNINGKSLTASAMIVIDRTKYNIKYRSGNFFQNLGDKLMYNDFELNVNLTANAV